MSENIKVENSTEYYKNGNVKAYVSTLYHTELGKKVKVRNKDYELYSQKFHEACELLELEWETVELNKNINSFIENSAQCHIYSSTSNGFNYSSFEIKQVHNEVDQTNEKPVYKELYDVPKEPLKTEEKYQFKRKWYHSLLFINVEKKKERLKNLYKCDLEKYYKIIEANKVIENNNKKIKEKYLKRKEEIHKEIRSVYDKYMKIYKNYKNAETNDGVANYFNEVMNKEFKYYNIFREINFEIDFDIDDKTLVVNFRFPTKDEFPQNKELKLIKTRRITKKVPFNEKEYNDLIKNSYYSLYIAIVNFIFNVDIENIVSNLVLNGFYKGIDTRKGKIFETCIMTSKINSKEFGDINLIDINPKDTFKYFSGKGSPNPDNIAKVEPIRFLDKSKFKLIESNDVLSSLSAETNLAAIDWKDFETLIKDVFELEFNEQDIEIRNTQHSNDGGIDVVAFNNNPYTGGVILLQAKRYTNTVTPEPVRALKGSMDEHKAIRGILVTTSDFGGSSREFASQHNITLINGDQLIELFKKHNYNFHIDLVQAKILNKKN